MNAPITYITEQCGALWAARYTAGSRGWWVFLVRGRSAARPSVVGFYADSINDACNALNN